MDKIVGIGEYAISNNGKDTIKTFALASCIAMTAYSPAKNAAGIIHIALPAPLEHEGFEQKTCYYAATGIPFLIDKMCREYGCLGGELEIRLYGGADSICSNDVFKIGQKNIEAVKSILLKMKLKASKTQVGGTSSRTLEMDVSTGEVRITVHPLRI